jgi:hypothetical protein
MWPDLYHVKDVYMPVNISGFFVYYDHMLHINVPVNVAQFLVLCVFSCFFRKFGLSAIPHLSV